MTLSLADQFLTQGPAQYIKRSMRRKYAAGLGTFILTAHLGIVASVLSAEPVGLSQSEKAAFSPRPSPPRKDERGIASDPALRPADYQPSGDYYDWRKTGQPIAARVYVHARQAGLFGTHVRGRADKLLK